MSGKMLMLVFLAPVLALLGILFSKEKYKQQVENERATLNKVRAKVEPKLDEIRDECADLEHKAKVLKAQISQLERPVSLSESGSGEPDAEMS